MENGTLHRVFETIRECDWEEAIAIIRAAEQRADEVGPPRNSTPEERESQIFLQTYKAFG